jgi:hypothetical protein
MKEEFLAVVNARIQREGIHDLLEWLEDSDWYAAPASTRFHLCKEGGLLEHSMNVYRRLLALCEAEYGELDGGQHETAAIIALFHDLCKIDFYKPEWRNVKVYQEKGSKFDNGGRFDWETKLGYTVDEGFCYGYHGPKSTFLIERFIRLTPEEAAAVSCHMGAFDRSPNDYSISNAFERYPLALLLHMADCLASFIDESQKEPRP